MSRRTVAALLVAAAVLAPGTANAAPRGGPDSSVAVCKPIGVEKTVCSVPGRSLRAGPIGPCIGGFGMQVFFLVVTDRTTVTVGTEDQDVQASEPLVVFGFSGCTKGGGAHEGLEFLDAVLGADTDQTVAGF